jgi:hypothetical protein
MDYSTIQDAEFRSGKRVLAVVASHTQIQSLIQQIYPQEAPAPLDALGKEPFPSPNLPSN